MKTPFLMFTATVLALTATSAFADGMRTGFRDRARVDVKEAWIHLREAGRDVREGVFESVEAIKAVSHDARHERPLLMSEYVTVVKKGKEVSLIYCESRIKRMANSQRCEKMHAGTFKIDDLKSCIDKVEGDKQPGMILNRNLKKAAESEYGHDHFKMYDSKASYQDYLEQCKTALAKKPGRSIAGRAIPRPIEMPTLELQPFEAPNEPEPFDIPAESSGSL